MTAITDPATPNASAKWLSALALIVGAGTLVIVGNPLLGLLPATRTYTLVQNGHTYVITDHAYLGRRRVTYRVDRAPQEVRLPYDGSKAKPGEAPHPIVFERRPRLAYYMRSYFGRVTDSMP